MMLDFNPVALERQALGRAADAIKPLVRAMLHANFAAAIKHSGRDTGMYGQLSTAVLNAAVWVRREGAQLRLFYGLEPKRADKFYEIAASLNYGWLRVSKAALPVSQKRRAGLKAKLLARGDKGRATPGRFFFQLTGGQEAAVKAAFEAAYDLAVQTFLGRQTAAAAAGG